MSSAVNRIVAALFSLLVGAEFRIREVVRE